MTVYFHIILGEINSLLDHTSDPVWLRPLIDSLLVYIKQVGFV